MNAKSTSVTTKRYQTFCHCWAHLWVVAFLCPSRTFLIIVTERHAPPPPPHSLQEVQQHYIHSIKSTVIIRQLPSQVLSFQLWPAATTLFSEESSLNYNMIHQHKSLHSPSQPQHQPFIPNSWYNIQRVSSGFARCPGYGSTCSVDRVLPSCCFDQFFIKPGTI